MSKPAENPRKKTEKKGPTGQEIMKRKPPENMQLRPAKLEFDPKKAYTTAQLAEIGAIALRWNQLEAHIDFVGSFILFNKLPIRLRFSIGKNLSNNKKISLLKEYVLEATLFDDKLKSRMTDTFVQVESCRSYRNAIIHHHIYDHTQGIGSFVDHDNSAHQILVSLEALTTLYNVLGALLEEVREIDLLFRNETDAQRPGRLDEATGEFHQFTEAELKKTEIPRIMKRLSALQKTRKELQKFPAFPDAELIRSFNEEKGSAE